MNLGARLVLYETGNLREEAAVKLFQDMIDIGVVWDDVSYSLTAKALILAGKCHKPKGTTMGQETLKVDVDTFVGNELDRLERFAEAYRAGRDTDPERFPETLTEDEYIEQYEAWLSYIMDTTDKNPFAVNENSPTEKNNLN